MPARSSAQRLVFDAAATGDAAAFQKAVDMLPKDVKIEDVQDDQGRTVLFVASSNGHENLVQQLVMSLGVNPNSCGRTGSALQAASSAGHPSVVSLLLQAGADPNTRPGFNGMSPLFLATATAALQSRVVGKEEEVEKAVECVQRLLNAGASPDTLAPGGYTPLHVAAEVGNVGLIDALLAAGAPTDLKTDQGQTARDIAISWGHSGVADKLRLPTKDRENAMEKEDKQIDDAAAHPQPTSIPVPEEPDPAKSKELQSQGNQAFVNGDFEKAFNLYRSALKHQTDNAHLWANSSAAALKLHRHEEALRDARMARTVDPKFVKAWYREGKAAEALEDWADAAAAYFEAHLLDPRHSSGIDFGALVKETVEKGRQAQKHVETG